MKICDGFLKKNCFPTFLAGFCVPFISDKKSPMHGIWSLHQPPLVKPCSMVISFFVSVHIIFKATS